MKRVKIAVAIFAATFMICIASLIHLDYVRTRMLAHIGAIEDAIAAGEQAEVIIRCEAFCDDWQKSEYGLLVHVRHDKVEDITAVVAKLPALAEYDHIGDLKAELESAQILIQHVWDSETPFWWENIGKAFAAC